jgi:hypothetical protein
MSLPLSGDKAYELFTSNEPTPLASFLYDWKEGRISCDVAYIIAVVGAYNHMTICHDGPRDGTYRPRVA